MAVTKNNLPLREYGTAHTLETIHARCVEVGDCWEWLGAMSHGKPTIRGEGRKVVSLRAYIAHNIQGIAPETGKYVTFNCGNRSALMKMTAKRTGYGMRPERRVVLGAVREARMDEREACAKACEALKTNPPANPDDSERGFNAAIRRAAAAIRARGSA